MGLRNAQARSRQLARQKAQQEQTDEDRFAFRRWKIRHDPGESGLYIPMLNGEGEYQIEEEIPAHKVGDSRTTATSETRNGRPRRRALGSSRPPSPSWASGT